MVFARTGTIIGSASATGLIAINTWYYIELQFFSHDTLGSFEIRINGSTVTSRHRS